MSRVYGLKSGDMVTVSMGLCFSKHTKLHKGFILLDDHDFVLPDSEPVIILTTKLVAESTIVYGLCRLGAGYTRLMSEMLVSVKTMSIEL